MSIILEQVGKTFQTGGMVFPALKSINVTINTGEFVAIVGKSGSGKSTLVNMITGIDTPTSGRICILDTEINQLKASDMAKWRGRNIGIIFQFFQLIPTLTLLENVMLPMDFCSMYAPKERKKRAEDLLAQVGLLEHAHKFPALVSGGQQQRAAIARALANDPPIIIADEPTGSLDSKTADTVFSLFEELARNGKTVVMVTHDNDLAKKVNRTIVVADGEIVNQYVVQAFPFLDIEQLSQLEASEKCLFAPGTIIIREGDEPDYAYLITSGEVEILISQPNGS